MSAADPGPRVSRRGHAAELRPLGGWQRYSGRLMASYKLRPAAPADLEVIGALEAATFSFEPYTDDLLALFLDRFAAFAFVAVAEGRLIGYVLAGPRARPEFELEPPLGWINSLAVVSAWRRQGVARALFSSAVAALAAAGCTIVRLYADPTEQAACAFYRDLGLREVPGSNYSGRPRLTFELAHSS